jgi:hypothetical protein
MATRKKRATVRKSAAKRPARKTIAKNARAKKTAARSPAARVRTKRAAKKSAPRTSRAKKPPAKRAKVAVPRPAVRKTAAAAGAQRRASASAGAALDIGLFPCGDDAIRAATGKDWHEWLTLLDASGAAARGLDHQRIWDLAMQSLPDSAGWWGQMVSVGYERARGLREKHESGSGEFQSTLSKTFAVPLFAAFAAWADEGLRGQWLDAPALSFTKLNAGKNIRARWPDGSLLDIRFNATGPDKCQIVVDTMKLADGDAVRKAKAYWQAQFERLQGYLKA